MALVAVSQILSNVQTLLQDPRGVRWPVAELVSWLNEGQLAIVSRRPDANMRIESFPCVSGTRQTLPSDGIRLVRVVRNTVSLRPIRPMSLNVMDDQLGEWHEPVDADVIQHYGYAIAEPKTFWVYPAPKAGLAIDITYSAFPDATTDQGFMTIDPAFQGALTDYIAYRALSKDADHTANGQRAQMHYAAFEQAIAEKTAADAALEGA